MSEDKAIVISTHILEEVDAVCSRAIIISSGVLMFDGTPTELIAKSVRNDIDHAFRIITTTPANEKRETSAP
jgi:ABC-2 type transport system ATP-binding protein